MNGLKLVGFFGVCVASLLGCSMSHEGSDAYLRSKNGPDLVVPSPLTSANMGQFYKLPAQNQDARVDITPPNTSHE